MVAKVRDWLPAAASVVTLVIMTLMTLVAFFAKGELQEYKTNQSAMQKDVRVLREFMVATEAKAPPSPPEWLIEKIRRIETRQTEQFRRIEKELQAMNLKLVRLHPDTPYAYPLKDEENPDG